MSRPFLSLVAEDLIERLGNDLSRVAVVFPGQRARLFFNNYLCEYSKEAIWAPQYLSIDDLFRQTSELQIADNIKLISELYKTYISIYNQKSTQASSETLDEFFFFGEILLNDLDEVDRNLVNSRSLFSNMQDLDQLRDDFSHLNEEQIETLIRYFNYAFHGNSSLKTAFWSIWNILGEVYIAFREKLQREKLAYPGMLMRSVIEDENARFKYDKYVFIGFNVLNKCETALFRRIKEKSLFYWDTDTYYDKGKDESRNEAGRFIRQNIEKFGSALPLDLFDNFLNKKKQITLIASPSESGQAAYIPSWLDSLNREAQSIEPDSAIVLCNEQLLPTVMHSIPPSKAENVNITMGFPITQTPVCGFIQVLTEMQVKGISNSGKNFHYKYVLPVLRHACTQAIFPEAKSIEQSLLKGNIFFPTVDILKNKDIFHQASTSYDLSVYLLTLIEQLGQSYKAEEALHTNEDIYSDLYQESVFRSYQVINRLSGLLQSGELDIEKTTFLRLLKKLLSSVNIPFHGEPVRGLQVMGVLETRNLDFKNVIFLSANEGFMPKSENDNTFIPQFLRKYFQLSTTEHQDTLYAYYFYRLIQRAENITFLYNTDKTQTGKSEMSRFLLQLLIEPKLNIRRYSLQASIKPVETQQITIPKTRELLERIRFQFDFNTNPDSQRLSPSALNIFVDCPLRFYLQYIENLRTEEELSDELDVSVFGTIFHRSAELLYREIGRIGEQKDFEPFVVNKQQLDDYLKNDYLIDKLVASAFSEEYFRSKDVTIKQYNGEQLINFRVIRHMLKRLIEFDKKQTPFHIYGLEKKVNALFELPDTPFALKIGGIIDRLEEKNGAIRIVDYKTGGSAKSYKQLSDLMERKTGRAAHIFQTFTYASVLIKNNISKPIVPSLLYVQDAGKDDYSPIIQYDKEDITDFSALYPEFKEILESKARELFDETIPFSQTKLVSTCTYCDFKSMCNR